MRPSPETSSTTRAIRAGRKWPLLLAACLALPMAQPALADDFTMASGVRLPEGNIRTPVEDRDLRNIGLDGCKAACRAETGCAAFTYYDEARWCFLKGSVGERTADVGTTSGIRVRAPARPRKTSFSFFGIPIYPPDPPLEAPLPERRPAEPETAQTPAGPEPGTASPGEAPAAVIKVSAPATPLLPDRKPAPPAEVKAALVAEPPEPARPIVETDKDARSLYKLVKASGTHAREAERLSARYLRQYDTAKPRTKMYRGPFGIRVPVHLNKSVSKALVLDKMGKDSRLNAAQDKLERLDRRGSPLFRRVVKKLDPKLRKLLTALHDANARAARNLKTARTKMMALGKQLNQKAARMKFPSPGELKALHRLAAVMRAKRRDSIAKGRAYRTALESALRKPMVAGYVRRLPAAKRRR